MEEKMKPYQLHFRYLSIILCLTAFAPHQYSIARVINPFYIAIPVAVAMIFVALKLQQIRKKYADSKP